MPAKRNPKKKTRTPSAKPSLAELTPPDLEALTVAPADPVALPTSPQGETPPPKAGPPPGRGARFAGRSQGVGQTRRYAFRRS